jgi:tRNA(adenine34) deaminase
MASTTRAGMLAPRAQYRRHLPGDTIELQGTQGGFAGHSAEDHLDWSPFDLPLVDPRHPFHLAHMEMALEEAALAAAEDEVPVGAVIVSTERGVIARAHNEREKLNDPTAHAEMIAITQAAQALKSWRLDDCLLYVTLEPCPMCAGAVVLARLPVLVYGAADPKAGACHTLYQIASDPRLNHRAQVISGVLADRCGAILSDFFAARRRPC